MLVPDLRPSLELKIAYDLSSHIGKTPKLNRHLRNQYSYNLMKDGLHPNINLSKVWLKKLFMQMLRDCWGIFW
jgi:hypothetical protein